MLHHCEEATALLIHLEKSKQKIETDLLIGIGDGLSLWQKASSRTELKPKVQKVELFTSFGLQKHSHKF